MSVRQVPARLAALALLGAAAPAVALGGGAAADIPALRVLAALALCVIIAVLAVLMLRQRSGKVRLDGLLPRLDLARRAIEIVETRRLGPHAYICLVRHDRLEYLLLLQAGSAQVLRQREMPEPVAGDGACG